MKPSKPREQSKDIKLKSYTQNISFSKEYFDSINVSDVKAPWHIKAALDISGSGRNYPDAEEGHS